MYSQRVIEAAVSRYESSSRLRLTRIDARKCQDWVAHLDARLKQYKGEQEELRKNLTKEELAFIRNERVMSMLDYEYCASRYHTIPSNGGGICRFQFWDSQRIFLRSMAKIEEEMHDRRSRGETVDGMLIVGHKARQLGECLVAGTLVLTADLRWVPIETLKAGDAVISVDEFSPKGARARKMRTATVLGTRMMLAPTYRILFEDGTEVRATANHPFLYRRRRDYAWVEVQHTKVGDEVRKLAAPWGSPGYEDGWFGGLLDGEGSHRAKRASGPEICVSQVGGPVLERAKQYLKDRGYTFRIETDGRQPGVTSKFGKQPVYKLVMHRSAEIVKLLGMTRPSRFMRSNFWEGRELPNGAWTKVAAIEKSIDQVVVNLETTTGTYIANGLVSHNTMLGRSICMHRLSTQQHRRAMAASVDDDKIQELYDRDKLIWDSLPWWLQPEIGYDTKAAHLYFGKLDSRIIYQVSSQKSGLGVGRQFDFAHLTELSTWINPSAVELDFFPTLPQSISTFCLLESTAYGRGNWWHEFTERVRKGLTRRWTYVFIPWYAEPSKYRSTPPPDWVPSEVAMLHAQKIHETSHEFIGHSLMIPRESLYWWETTREEYRRAGNLNFFLTNYCSTPEESFQHSGQSAFDPELIESLRLNSSDGIAYEMVRTQA